MNSTSILLLNVLWVRCTVDMQTAQPCNDIQAGKKPAQYIAFNAQFTKKAQMIEFSIDVLPFYWVSSNSRTHKLNVGMMSWEQIERVAMPGSGHRQESVGLKEIQMNAGSLLSFLFSIHKPHLNCFPFRFQFSSVHSFYEPKWETWFAVRGLRNKKNIKSAKAETKLRATSANLRSCTHIHCLFMHTKTYLRRGWIPGVIWGEVECAAVAVAAAAARGGRRERTFT